jgi:hypothetical protein
VQRQVPAGKVHLIDHLDLAAAVHVMRRNHDGKALNGRARLRNHELPGEAG